MSTHRGTTPVMVPQTPLMLQVLVLGGPGARAHLSHPARPETKTGTEGLITVT